MQVCLSPHKVVSHNLTLHLEQGNVVDMDNDMTMRSLAQNLHLATILR